MQYGTGTGMDSLEDVVKDALHQKKGVAVYIKMPDLESLEVIFNPYENLDKKLEYYKKTYNANLELKSFKEIKIVKVRVCDFTLT